jgi:Recombination endonuclease VII
MQPVRSTFLQEYGHVQYRRTRNTTRYRKTGPCDVPGCTNYRVQIRDLENVLIRSDEKKLEQLLTLDPVQYADGIRNDKRAMMLRQSIDYQRTWRAGIPARYEHDHCHRHGWVRGVVCKACNTAMAAFDRGYALDYQNAYPRARRMTGVLLRTPDYNRYSANCPEC